jgi:hypothetical protein
LGLVGNIEQNIVALAAPTVVGSNNFHLPAGACGNMKTAATVGENTVFAITCQTFK